MAHNRGNGNADRAEPSAADLRRWRQHLSNERAEAGVYRDLAQRRTGAERKLVDLMDSSTFGLPINSRLGYRETIAYATRIRELKQSHPGLAISTIGFKTDGEAAERLAEARSRGRPAMNRWLAAKPGKSIWDASALQDAVAAEKEAITVSSASGPSAESGSPGG